MHRPPFRYRPRFEALEERSQPAVFRVTQSFDLMGTDGMPLPGTLRWAIQLANQHPNKLNPGGAWDVITFQVPPASPLQIVLDRPLDKVTEPVILDGSQQPGFDPLIDGGFPILTPELPDATSAENLSLINVWFETRKRTGQPRKLDRPVDPLIPESLDEPGEPPTTPEIKRRKEIDAFFIRPEPPLPPPLDSWQAGCRFPAASSADPPVFFGEDESQIGKIMGTLFEDDDGDGVRGPDEPAAAERVVYLDLNQNGRLDDGEPTAVTNQQGEYRFEHLRPNTYHVDRVLWPHRQPTLPEQGRHVVDLAAGEVIMDLDFGEVKVQKRRIPVSIPDGDSRRPDEFERPSSALIGLAGVFVGHQIFNQRSATNPERQRRDSHGAAPAPAGSNGWKFRS